MMSVILGFTAIILGIAVWTVVRRRRVGPPTAMASPAAADERETAAATGIDAVRLEIASDRAAARLWKLAFAASNEKPAAELIDRRVRDNVMAMLQVDTLDPKLFPRRPVLMPQLLQAVNEPGAAAARLSRIVAHDPVLTADVLRLANSSLYRMSATPVETIQRAIVICGVDGLRGMLAAVMLRPVFRASARNFPRLPRMLWDRTERASRAAELYALQNSPQDRFEAQLVVLLSALGPLVVYGAVLDVYSRNPSFSPSGALCVELVGELALQISRRIARDWQISPRLLAALDQSPGESLMIARHVGELFGTLSFLESQTVISRQERRNILDDSGMPPQLADSLWGSLNGNAMSRSPVAASSQ